MNRKKAKSEGYKVVIIGLILILMVGGYYFYLSNKSHKTEEEPVKITAVQEALMYNFDRNYPPTPKEVVQALRENDAVLSIMKNIQTRNLKSWQLKIEEPL